MRPVLLRSRPLLDVGLGVLERVDASLDPVPRGHWHLHTDELGFELDEPHRRPVLGSNAGYIVMSALSRSSALNAPNAPPGFSGFDAHCGPAYSAIRSSKRCWFHLRANFAASPAISAS